MNIVIIGGASYDHIIHLHELPVNKPDSHFAKEHYHVVGGSGIGKALNLNRLLPITFLTKFGTDEAGLNIKKILEAEHVPYIADFDPVGSTTHTNLMDPKGDRVSLFTSVGSDSLTLDIERHRNIIMTADLIVLNISFFCKQYIPLIKESNAEVWTDIHDWDGEEEYHKDFIDVSDVVFMSSDKSKEYYADIVNMLLEDKKFVVVTHGKEGSEYFSKNIVFKRGIIPVKMIDSNGAGDAFFSGFLYGYSLGESAESCMKYGMIVSGLSVTSKKLFSDKLNIKEIKKHL